MSELLVSYGVYSDLASRWRWIDYDPDAMAKMAETLNVPPPDSREPVYVIHENDVNVQIATDGPSGGTSQKVLPMDVYYQDPVKSPVQVLPNHKVFAVMLKDTGFDDSALTQAVADRLVLPRRRQRERAVRAFGGALAVGGMGLIYNKTDSKVGLAAAVSGFILMAWGGPRPLMPDLNNVEPPLFLTDHSPWA